MLGRLVFVFACALVAVSALPFDLAEKIHRIVGGQTAAPGEFGYMASLRGANFRNHFCGGSILSERWIMTAAHCVFEDQPGDIIAVVGAHNINETLDEQPFVNHVVDHIYVHDLFTMDDLGYDIALLHLAEDIQFNDYVRSIDFGREFVGAGQNVIASGWGRTYYQGPLPDELQFMNQTTLTNIDCRARHPVYADSVDDNHLCAYAFSYGIGLCHGDSGSPLVLNDQVVGIACWVHPCARGYPDQYVRPSAHVEWLDAILGTTAIATPSSIDNK